MRVDDQLAVLRKRLLRRFVADSGLCPAEVALAIGVSPAYLQKLLSGTRVVTDAIAWRLSRRYGVPFELLEASPSALELSPQRAQSLRRDVLAWRHNGAAVFAPSCR